MPTVLVHEGPTLTQEKYEQVVQELTGGSGLQSPSDWPVPGLLVHIAGETPSGFRVVDVWESDEAIQSFGETLGPILERVGVTETPTTYPAQTFVSA